MNILLAIFLGLAAAWLVNYLSDVLPILRRFGQPTCTHCGTSFRWQDYFFLRACRECKQARSWRTTVTLAAGPVVAVLLQLFPPVRQGPWLGLLILTYFGVVLVIDLEHRMIMHVVSLAGAVIGLLAGVFANGWVATLLGGLAGLSIMLIFYLVGILFARYRARKRGVDDGEEALGFGDVTLSAVIGLILGWPLITTGLFIGILAGGVVSLLLVIVLVASRRYETMNVFTAYGPYLLLGATWVMFFPQVAHLLSGQ